MKKNLDREGRHRVKTRSKLERTDQKQEGIMNKAQIGKLLALVACVACAVELRAQTEADGPEVIYRNGSDPLIGYYSPDNNLLEYGDELELDGTSRFLSSIKLEYFSSEATGSAVIRVREMNGDLLPGTGPMTYKPGSIIYESPSISLVNHLNTIYIQHEDIPLGSRDGDNPLLPSGKDPSKNSNILVSLQLSGLAPDQQVGALLRNPPTHGQSADDIWISDTAGDWALATIPGASANFAIEVVAVPEPSSILLAILGGAVLFGARRMRRA